MSSRTAQFAFALEDADEVASASDESMDPGRGRTTELWWAIEGVSSAFAQMSPGAEVAMPPRQRPSRLLS